jgi:hypothetical protein
VGLDHPDEKGQRVTAIMNSRVSDIDRLKPDDIRGGQALYGARPGISRAVFTSPSAAISRVQGSSYVFRGHANAIRASAVYLVNTRLGVKRYFKATGLEFWHRSLSLLPGTNVIQLYVRTPAGTLQKVATRTVIR